MIKRICSAPTVIAHNRIVFPIIALSLLMITIDSTIVATALHSLQNHLHTSIRWAGWTLTAYSFGIVIMLPISAHFSVQLGHKRVFIASVLVFSAASFLCGLSVNIETLICMRILQAIGGSGITPSATGIIVEHFGKSRDTYLGLFGSFFAIGSMLGPIFGGIFVTYLTWQWIFFINIPFGLIASILTLKLVPRDKNILTRTLSVDWKGMILLASALLASMLAATYLGNAEHKVLSYQFLLLISIGIASFAIFIRHITLAPHPLIHPQFIFGKGFGAVNSINIIHAGMVIGGISLLPFYAIQAYNISELHAGTLLVGEGILSIVMTVIMSLLLRRSGYRLPIYIGGTALAIGFFLLYLSPIASISPYIWLIISSCFIGFGVGTISPAARNAGMQLAPKESAKLAAIRSLGLQMGQIITITISTSIVASSQHAIAAQATIYLCFAIILAAGLWCVQYVPENKGAW